MTMPSYTGSGAEKSRLQAQPPVLVSSHPRSGTHLLIDFIRCNFPQTRINKRPLATLDHLYLNVERTTSENRHFSAKSCARIIFGAPRCLIKTHYLSDFSESWTENETGPLRPDVAGLIAAAKMIYVYRHPVCVLNSYRELLAADDPDLNQVSLTEFAQMKHWNGQDTHLEWWARHVSGWIVREDVLTLKFEDILAAPKNAVQRIAGHIGLKAKCTGSLMPPHTRSVWKGRLDRLLPGHPKSTAINPKAWAQRASIAERAALVAKMQADVRELTGRLGYSFESLPVRP